MKEKILVLSGAGTGKELAERLLYSTDHEFKGFLDDFKTGGDILGQILDFRQFPEYKLLSALGSYRNMSRRAELLASIPKERFASFVDPTAVCYETARLGNDVAVFPYAVVSSNVSLADHILVYHHAIISHECTIGEGTIISNAACLSGIVHVGKNCYIGAGAVIREKTMIGNNVIVASNATVVGDVPDDVIFINQDDIRINQYTEKTE